MVADEQGLDVRTADVGVMQILVTAALQALGGNRASTIFTSGTRAIETSSASRCWRLSR